MFSVSRVGGLLGGELGTPVGLTDPDFSSVVLLTGLNAATPIDDSNTPHTLTVNSAVRDTSDKKFGASSFSFGNGTENISAADHADWNLGSGDFTIELFTFFDTAPISTDDPPFISQYDTTGDERSWALSIANGNLRFRYSTNGTSAVTTIEAAWAPSVTTWDHIAVSRTGGNVYLFTNGSQIYTAALSATFFDSSAAMHIGFPVNDGGTNIQRNIDEVRITKGVGRYSGNFTAPTAEFPRS